MEQAGINYSGRQVNWQQKPFLQHVKQLHLLENWIQVVKAGSDLCWLGLGLLICIYEIPLGSTGLPKELHQLCSFNLLPEPELLTCLKGLQEEGARICSHLEPGRVSPGWASAGNFVAMSSALIYCPLGRLCPEPRLMRKLAPGSVGGTQLCLIIRTYDKSVYSYTWCQIVDFLFGPHQSFLHPKTKHRSAKEKCKRKKKSLDFV